MHVPLRHFGCTSRQVHPKQRQRFLRPAGLPLKAGFLTPPFAGTARPPFAGIVRPGSLRPGSSADWLRWRRPCALLRCFRCSVFFFSLRARTSSRKACASCLLPELLLTHPRPPFANLHNNRPPTLAMCPAVMHAQRRPEDLRTTVRYCNSSCTCPSTARTPKWQSF